MNSENWYQLLIQVPLVGAFIWFTLRLTKMNQEAQAKRDEAYLAALEKISSTLQCHDSLAREAFGVLLDRQERVEGPQEEGQAPGRSPALGTLRKKKAGFDPGEDAGRAH